MLRNLESSPDFMVSLKKILTFLPEKVHVIISLLNSLARDGEYEAPHGRK
jgi:hypothetical protein